MKNPGIITDGARAFGRQCVVLGMDVLRVGESSTTPSGYEVVINGGRTRTGLDAVQWAKKAEDLGAGEICLNAIDTDGVRQGYELTITRMISDAVGIPVIASGGAGEPHHLVDAVTKGGADAALIASMVHTGAWTVCAIKESMAKAGVPVRLDSRY